MVVAVLYITSQNFRTENLYLLIPLHLFHPPLPPPLVTYQFSLYIYGFVSFFNSVHKWDHALLVFFCLWLISLSMSSMCVHVVTNSKISFFYDYVLL